MKHLIPLTCLTFFPSFAFAEESKMIDISLNAQFIAGFSSADDITELATHSHDPNQERTIQGIELGLSVNPHEYLSGYFNINTFLTTEDELDSEWEEGFLKLHNLPYNFEVRGGRYLNRIGRQNNVHLHGWDFVDSHFSTTTFLGDEGLVTEGGELSWFADFEKARGILSASYGSILQHDHGSHGEHEDHHDEEEEEEDHDEEEHGDEHGLEEANFAENAFTLRAVVDYNFTDFLQNSLGLSYATGENGYGRETSLYGIDYQFTWRENGLESGGQAVTLGLEYFQRGIEWEEEDLTGDTTQSGFMAQIHYKFADFWTLSCRYDWVEGVQDGLEMEEDEIHYALESDERKRLSLALTHTRPLFDNWSGTTRLQYNHDELHELGGEDSLWFQLGFSYGLSEVR